MMASHVDVRITGAVEVIDGIRCFAPELAHAAADYPPEAFDRLYRLEEGHFWFRARNRILRQAFRRFLAQRPSDPPSVLEIGCGTGFVLRGLAAEGRYRLMGAEAHLTGLGYAKRRLPEIDFVQLDARALPFTAEFDAIGAFDVIEHIDDDAAVIRSVHRALKPGGLFFVSVPQHRWLWSEADVHAHHKRRYVRAELRRKLEEVGFEIAHMTSFVTALLPCLYAARLMKRGASEAPARSAELELPRPLNWLFDHVMRIDEVLIRAGLSLPAGGSLLAVARKRSAGG